MPLVVSAILVLSGPALALHRDSAPAIRVTHGSGATIPSTRGWRTWLPLTSTDSAGRQVYLFDLWTYDCVMKPNGIVRAACAAHPPPFLMPVTSGPGAPDNPSVNGVGKVVAFDADGAYAGGTGPGAGHRQIFLLDRKTATLRRVTDAADGDSTRPSLDDAGRWLVFESTAGLAGGASGVAQIFLYDVATRSLEQLTRGAGPSHEAMLDKTGKRAAFTSTADLLGDGRDTGIAQVFWYDRAARAIHQMTRGNAPSRRPYIAIIKPALPLRTLLGIPLIPGGHAIVFESDATDLPGTRANPGPQVFFGSMKGSDLPEIVQLTPPPVAGCPQAPDATASAPVADPTGRRIFFTSPADLLCNGTTGRRLFSLGIGGRVGLVQLTRSGDVERSIAALGGWFAALSTSEDLSGTGVCGHQLHVLNFFDGMWQPATGVGALPQAASPGPPAASCDDTNVCTADACTAGGCTHLPIPACGALRQL